MPEQKRYEIYEQGMSYAMMETDSFSQAIAYAKTNGWLVYDNTKSIIIYDGYLDEFTI